MAEKPKVDKAIVITGILCITLLEIVATLKGFNGKLLASSIGILALAIGVGIPGDTISRILKHIRIVK